MIARCANPICGAHFRYLNQGRVYNVPVYAPGTTRETQSTVGPRRVEHFWLCSVCCLTLTLTLRNGKAEIQARYPLLTDGGTPEAPQEPAQPRTRIAAA